MGRMAQTVLGFVGRNNWDLQVGEEEGRNSHLMSFFILELKSAFYSSNGLTLDTFNVSAVAAAAAAEHLEWLCNWHTIE